MSKAVRNVYSTNNTKIKYSIIIPTAGLATRMKSYGPKSLIKINNKTILQRQLDWVKKNFPTNETILVGGFMADNLFNNTPDDLIKIENERYAETNVARSIGMALRTVSTNNIIIINGDLVFKNIKISFPKTSCIVTCDRLMSDNEVGCNISDNRLSYLMYDLPKKWAQIAYLTDEVLEAFKSLVWNRDNEKKYTFELLNELVETGHKIHCLQPKNFWCNDIDSIKDIRMLQDSEYINYPKL